MPPKNKKKGRNGFYYFMLDVKQDEADRGNVLSMEELQAFANPLWRDMSLDEKEYYNKRAKDEKFNMASDDERKFNSMGVSFAAAEAVDREKEEQTKIMKAEIRNTVQSSSPEALARKPFYVCHVNYYFQTDSCYQPAEIALAEFTLEDGLTNTLHFIVDPGKIPLGVQSEAQIWAEKTHSIRLTDTPTDHVERERNYVKIFAAVVQFLKRSMAINQGSMVLPVVYTMPESKTNNTSLDAVKYCLSFLSGCAHENRNLFRVYPLPELFFHLRKKWGDAGGTVPSVGILESEIEKDVFSYALDLGCKYHEYKDLTINCSLSKVKRWVFTICDHINPLAGLPMIPGHHTPQGVDLSWSAVEPKKKPHMNPKAEVGYITPAQNKPDLKFVDLSKLQELRIREKEAMEEELSEARRMPPPQKLVFAGGPPPPGLGTVNDDDFPPIGGRAGGRGPVNPKAVSSVWPISGRGKYAK